jgi:RNA polymerase sigma-70 factor (ECF subfamily)
MRAHGGWLLAYCLRLTGGDRAWAEDVVQETFERAWRHMDRLTADRGSVPGWLRRVAHNRAVDDHRARRCRPSEVALSDDVDAAEPTSFDAQVVQQMVIADVLATLPLTQRQALETTIMQDHTAAEAARILGLPVGTVKSRVFYGLRALRASLAQIHTVAAQQQQQHQQQPSRRGEVSTAVGAARQSDLLAG